MNPSLDPIDKSSSNNAFVIKVDELTRSFGDIVAVDHLSLRVRRGEIFGFLGPNGAGKTTTIKMLCGLLAPTYGNGQVVGYDLRHERHQIKCNSGYMAQNFSLYPDLTCEENFRFFSGVYGIYGEALRKRMRLLFDRLELAERSRTQAGKLSGGMRQRLALACALVHSPELVFLDEPTAGVDPNQRQRLWDLLYDLCQEGTTLFVTTHYLDEAERCHNVGFMLDGHLIAHDSPPLLKKRLQDHMIGIEVRNTVPALRAVRLLPDVRDVTLYGYELRVFYPTAIDWRTKEEILKKTIVDAGSQVINIYPLQPTLEDLFMSFTHQLRDAQAA